VEPAAPAEPVPSVEAPVVATGGDPDADLAAEAEAEAEAALHQGSSSASIARRTS